LKGKKVEDSPFLNFEYFSNYWNDYLFQTNELNSLKYRYMRQLCEISIKKFDEEKYKKYPNVIQDIIDSIDIYNMERNLSTFVPYYLWATDGKQDEDFIMLIKPSDARVGNA
jgi:hypothetical protein